MKLSRHEFLVLAGGLVVSACRTLAGPAPTTPAHLSARPHMPANTLKAGEHRLGPASGRAALLYVPETVVSKPAIPVVVMLHGAGGNSDGARFAFAQAERVGAVVLAPESREETWDVILGGFGPDVAFINTVLQQTFDTVSVDTEHIAIGGFSDGASYALSLGLANGTLFTHLMAFSPGFQAAPGREGQPRIFISHGTADTVLPIQTTSRRIVPDLRRAGYTVEYQEFEGPHTVPAAIAQHAFDWLI